MKCRFSRLGLFHVSLMVFFFLMVEAYGASVAWLSSTASQKWQQMTDAVLVARCCQATPFAGLPANTGGSASSITNSTGITAPYWVRLVRTEDTFTAFVSPDGINWASGGTTIVPMNANVYVGLVVGSVNYGTLCETQFDNVTLASSAFTISLSLSVSPGSGTLMLNWPAASPGFTLESSPSLGNDAMWTPVTNATILTGASNQVTIPMAGSTLFFRLQS
jgi:hypothetical protein